MLDILNRFIYYYSIIREIERERENVSYLLYQLRDNEIICNSIT